MALNSSDEALQILEKALQELTKTTTLSKDTLNKINGVLGKVTKEEEANADALAKNTDSLAELTKTLVSATKTAVDIGQSIRENREDLTSLNPAIDAAGAVLGKASDMLATSITGAGEAVSGMGNNATKFGKGLNILGSAISGAGKVVGIAGNAISELGVDFLKFSNEELQKVVVAFREVGSVGAIGAEGMTGLYDQAAQAGIAINQFSKIIADNGQGLAMATGNTETGAKVLAKLAESSKPFQREMLGLGYGISEQRDYQARFIKYNRLVGQIDTRNDKEMAVASKQYMENLDLLSRLTGKSRDQLAKEQEQRMQSVRYQAGLQDIEAKSGSVARQQYENVTALLQTYMPSAVEGWKDSIANSATEAGQNFRMQFGELGSQIQEAVKAGDMKGVEAAIKLFEYANQQRKNFGAGAIAAQSGINQSFQPMIDSMQEASTAQNLTKEELEKALKSQGAAKKATDGTTGKIIDAQEAMQEMANQMDKIVKDNLLPNAAVLIKGYSQALEGFIKWANKKMGHGEAGGESGTPSGAGAAAAQSSSAAEDMAWGGTNVAGMGSAAVPSDVSGDKAGGAAAGAGAAAGGGASAGSTQQILDTIKSKESSGNYQAQAKGSSASGAYQFIDSTWQSLAKKYGIGTEFARAADAPPQVQDAVAAKYVEDILKKTGGDVSKVPNVWYTGNTEGRMSDKALAANRGQTAEQYQSKWMAEFGKVAGGAMASPTTVATAQPQQMSPEQVAAIKQKMFEGRQRMAYKDPNGKVITQAPEGPWAASGGVFSGPKTGYSATLHGNEAVVPLPSGDKIPVEMGGISDVMDEQMSMMADQVDRLDQLAKLLRTGTEISNRILRVSQV